MKTETVNAAHASAVGETKPIHRLGTATRIVAAAVLCLLAAACKLGPTTESECLPSSLETGAGDATGCGPSATEEPDALPAGDSACSLSSLEAAMDTTLAGAVSEVDFAYAVERPDGQRYEFNRGNATLQTAYESASTSKLVSAVIILRLVEQGYLSLSDSPQDRIPDWPIGSDDPLYGMRLAHLLSFTSGLEKEPLCLNYPAYDFGTCVDEIASANAGADIQPGQRFHYAGTHLQVAGLMAVNARGAADWQALFSEFQSQTGLFPTAAYDLPSATNPRLAGGMHWIGDEYLSFLRALSRGELLNAEIMNELLTDHTATATTAGGSPTLLRLGEDWHYGFGLWHECRSATFNCTPGARVSSPGAYGAYPFWDRDKGYIGLVARQGELGTFPNGVAIEREVRSDAEAWVACE